MGSPGIGEVCLSRHWNFQFIWISFCQAEHEQNFANHVWGAWAFWGLMVFGFDVRDSFHGFSSAVNFLGNLGSLQKILKEFLGILWIMPSLWSL